MRVLVSSLLAALLSFICPSTGAQEAAPALPIQLETIDHVVGTGKEVRAGAYVALHYTGFIYDATAAERKGPKFIDSRERGETLTYKYGVTRAIPGFEKGLRGMKSGGKRTIVVPPKLGYDDRKYPTPKDVPPGSALVFDVELIDVVPESAP